MYLSQVLLILLMKLVGEIRTLSSELFSRALESSTTNFQVGVSSVVPTTLDSSRVFHKFQVHFFDCATHVSSRAQAY